MLRLWKGKVTSNGRFYKAYKESWIELDNHDSLDILDLGSSTQEEYTSPFVQSHALCSLYVNQVNGVIRNLPNNWYQMRLFELSVDLYM